MVRWSFPILVVAFLLAGCAEINQDANTRQVGPGPDGALVPTGELVRGKGEKVVFAGRPVDMAIAPDATHIYVKDINTLRVLEVSSWKETGSISIPGGASLTGILVNSTGDKVYVSNAQNKVIEFDVTDPAAPKQARALDVPGPEGSGNSFPCGMAWMGNDNKMLVCLSRNNTIGVIDMASGTLQRQIPVGIAPYDVEYAPTTDTAVVSNQGGSHPDEEDETAPSSGTEVAVDERGVLLAASVSLVKVGSGAEITQIETGLQPADIVLSPDQSLAYVAEANNDSVSVINIADRTISKRMEVKPDPNLPFGSMPSALALSPDGHTLYVVNAGNNAVAVIDTAATTPKGFIPTDWNPYAAIATQDQLFILNNKGKGARMDPVPDGKALNSHDKSATVQKLKIPTAQELASFTTQVKEDAKVPQTLAAYERSRNTSAKPVPVPTKLGEPSLFKHVVYVIKENRTYDQLFGNMPEGDGEPSLNIFGEDVVPNQRALARQYVLLDNYYCNGVLSADGHSWATEGNVTPYLNRAFGGFTRSYTFGDDPITYSTSGFIWDGVLAAGLTFRNYGEMDYAEPVESGKTGKQIWEDYVAKKPQEFTQNIGIANLRRYSCRAYPGWNMNIPDQLRIDEFLKEFREFEKTGDFPNFTIVYLPQDHAGGAVSARSNVADNDLAVGRLVEAITNSQFYKDTVVFINEDDPQAGTDHVDGHRSICLVVSPYSRKQGTVSEFYNQTSVLRTIGQIFGIAPMNQRDASSSLMTACFNSKLDTSPYKAITPKTPLDEFPSEATMSAKQLAMYKEVKKIDLREREVQTPAEMDLLNRYVWHQQMGFKSRYPAEWAGAHGKGLKERGLEFDPDGDGDDDD